MTVEKVVNDFCKFLTEEEKIFIQNNDYNSVHHSFGRSLRNDLNLWSNDNPVKLDAINNYGIAHADDISGLISAWIWAKVRNEDFNQLEHCKKYHDHWKKFGTTALKAGNWHEYGWKNIDE